MKRNQQLFNFIIMNSFSVANFILSLLLLFLIPSSLCQTNTDCCQPLGMQNKSAIPDEYLTATSSHALGTGPQYARLHSDEGDGAWCPKDVIEPGSRSKFLQIQLPHAAFITRIATQGRYGKGYGREYVRSYMVNYSRDGVLWFGWSNHAGVRVLQGNTNVRTVKIQSFYPGIAGAKFIRIIPVTSRHMPVCLRLELYGCPWQSGLVSYSIPTPDHPPSALHMFSDDTYDGERGPVTFTGGLGQLTDRVIGSGEVKKTASRFATNATGYDFVGWSPEKGKKVLMEFRFDRVRNFTSMRVFCNTDQSVGASLFSSFKVLSTLDGATYSKIEGRMTSKSTMDRFTSRVVYIPLRKRLALSLQVEFELGKGRLLISEVRFSNKLLSSNESSRISTQYPWSGDGGQVTQTPTSGALGANKTAIIVGVLGAVIFLLVAIVVGLSWRQRSLRKTLSPPSYTFRAGSSREDDMIALNSGASSPPNPPLHPPLIETKASSPIYHEIPSHPPPSTNMYLEPIRVLGSSPPPPYQASSIPSSSGNSRRTPSHSSHYAETDLVLNNFTSQALQGVSGNNIYSVPCLTPSPKRIRCRRRVMSAQTLPNLHGTNRDTNDVAVEEEHSALLASFNVVSSNLPPEFPRNKLEFIEKLGEGQFGEVQLCLADSSIRELGDEDWFSIPGSSRGKVLVAVKVLHEDATNSAKENFFKEVQVMSRLLHGNIVRLLAVCTEAEPFAMITEYMARGDLNQFLQRFDDDIKPSPNRKTIRNDSLLKMGVQVAAGMDYLSSLNFIHRDLAARNCLVGAGEQIRIGDFGMSRDMYQSDYYRIQGRAVLPIRWMSWECVLMGVFSSASDVWSFGVTLWEIYSFCKHQPYSRLSDQQVIDNMHDMFRRTKSETFLPRPKRCPASMFNVIRKCWRRDSQVRPTFPQLHSYLRERMQTCKVSPKPIRPQGKPPKPRVKNRKPL